MQSIVFRREKQPCLIWGHSLLMYVLSAVLANEMRCLSFALLR